MTAWVETGLLGNIHPQEAITEVDKTFSFVGEELRSDLVKPVTPLGEDTGGAQNADVLGGILECRIANDV